MKLELYIKRNVRTRKNISFIKKKFYEKINDFGVLYGEFDSTHLRYDYSLINVSHIIKDINIKTVNIRILKTNKGLYLEEYIKEENKLFAIIRDNHRYIDKYKYDFYTIDVVSELPQDYVSIYNNRKEKIKRILEEND